MPVKQYTQLKTLKVKVHSTMRHWPLLLLPKLAKSFLQEDTPSNPHRPELLTRIICSPDLQSAVSTVHIHHSLGSPGLLTLTHSTAEGGERAAQEVLTTSLPAHH